MSTHQTFTTETSPQTFLGSEINMVELSRWTVNMCQALIIMYAGFNSSRRDLYNDISTISIALIVPELEGTWGKCPLPSTIPRPIHTIWMTYMGLKSCRRYLPNNTSTAFLALVVAELKVLTGIWILTDPLPADPF